MKRWMAAIIAGTIIVSAPVVGTAADPAAQPIVTISHTSIDSYTAYHLVVNGKALTTTDLPAPAHNKNGIVMVPLRRTAEALGYTVTWDEALQRTRLDMSIASMEFYPEMKDYERLGKLKHINLNHLYDFKAQPEFIEGVLYVPADVFTAFLNDVTVEGNTVSIAPQVSYLMMGQ